MQPTQISARAAELASRLEQATATLLAAVEPCSEAQWQAECPNEGRTLGVMVHHIASAAPLVLGWAELVASGQALPPITLDHVHVANAEHAHAHAGCAKDATLALLRQSSAAAAARIRTFSDEQLDRSAPFAMFGGQPTSTQLVLEMILIGHIQGFPHSHLPNIQAGLQ